MIVYHTFEQEETTKVLIGIFSSPENARAAVDRYCYVYGCKPSDCYIDEVLLNHEDPAVYSALRSRDDIPGIGYES